jgi:hypothetical protein
MQNVTAAVTNCREKPQPVFAISQQVRDEAALSTKSASTSFFVVSAAVFGFLFE